MQQKRKRSVQVASAIGSNVAIAKSRVLNRMSKNESVLHKHLKWLKELQEERRQLEEKKKADQRAQLERKRLFMERQARKRAASKVVNNPETKKCASFAQDLPKKDVDDATVALSIASTESKRKKPAWCQSGEAAEVEAESALLDFVDGLDFEQYNEDLELQSLMGQVKERIKKLERENKKDENKLQTYVDSEKAAQRAEALEKGPVVDLVPADTENDEDEADDTESIANSVMSESTIGSIHSKKSLSALVWKARERRSEMVPVNEEEGETAVLPPILSTVTDDDGARIAEKKSINKLAFKNRNPAL